jgi:hypothetical protein
MNFTACFAIQIFHCHSEPGFSGEESASSLLKEKADSSQKLLGMTMQG